MKKIILTLLLISFLAVPFIGLTVSPIVPAGPLPTGIDPITAIQRITLLLFNILMGVAIIFVFWGAFLFFTAGGEKDQIQAGRNKIMWALIAVIVAVLAQATITWVRTFFGG